MDAVPTLADPSGAAVLRMAAKEAGSKNAGTKDAEAMRKAAAYLDLPSAQMSDLIDERKRRSAGGEPKTGE